MTCKTAEIWFRCKCSRHKSRNELRSVHWNTRRKNPIHCIFLMKTVLAKRITASVKNLKHQQSILPEYITRSMITSKSHAPHTHIRSTTRVHQERKQSLRFAKQLKQLKITSKITSNLSSTPEPCSTRRNTIVI